MWPGLFILESKQFSMRSFLFISLALLFINLLAVAQPGNIFARAANKKTGSLLQELKKAGEDTNKVNTLEELYYAYSTDENYSEAAKYNNEAWLLAKKIGYIKGEARCMVNKAYECHREKKWEEILIYSLPAAEMLKKTDDTHTKARCATITGYSYYYSSIYPEAIKCFLEAVMNWKELKNDKAILSLSLRLSECFDYMGNYTLAFEKATEALELSIKTGDKSSEAICYQHISGSYAVLKKYKEAKEFLEKALKINKATGETFRFAQIQNALAEISLEENNFSEAEKYISAALKIYETPGAPSFGKPWCYTLFAQVNECRGDSALIKNNKNYAFKYYRVALKNLATGLQLSKEIDNSAFITEKYIWLGRVNRKLKNYSVSRTYLLKAIPLTKELSLKVLTAEGYHELSSLDSMEGNFKSAFENSKQYKIYSDSLALEAEKGKTESFIIQAEINKKEEEIKLLATENKLKTAESEKQSQQKKFAYASIALVLVFSSYGFYRYRSRKKNEMVQAKLKDRLNISRGLHDDMGSTLSSISVYSKVAQIKSDENNKQELNDVLEKISMASGEMVVEMNDTVWAINPGNDNMEKIIQRMESFAKPLAAARNIHFDLQYDKSILSLQLNMDKRKNFYLIFKEAINNAIKYSGASELNALIQSDNHLLKLTVKDNGVGFNTAKEMTESTSLSGNGLRNMYSRANELNGSLIIQSQPGNGTAITLQLPHA